MSGKRTQWTEAFVVLIWAAAALGRASVIQAANAQILVAAAVSLKEAFNEIGAVYRQRTGVIVTFSFGGSGELEKQIEAGAPVDVFASAGEKEMQELRAKRLIDRSTQAKFVRNVLVLVVPVDSKLQLHSFLDLGKPGAKMIAVGNPRTVPAGRYAKELLEEDHLWRIVQPRLIFAENVRQVLDYVDHGDVDAGVVYATDVAIAHGKVRVAARAPDGAYGPILYPIAVVKGSRNAQASRGFVKLVLSSTGTRILRKHGFLPVR